MIQNQPKQPLVSVILPVRAGKGKKWGNVSVARNLERRGLEVVEIAAKDLKQKAVIDFNPRSGFWTVKIGFLWGRDQDFVKAAGQCLEQVLPLIKAKDEKKGKQA